MIKISFEEQKVVLQEFGNWLKEIGIKTKENRIPGLVDFLDKMITHTKNKTMNDLVASESPWIYTHFIETNSLIFVYEMLKNLPSHMRPKSILEKIILGPDLSKDEDTPVNNVEPRNRLFELEVATMFHNIGAKIIRFDDVEFDFDQNKYFVQCKRLHSNNPQRIEGNINKAYSQLERQLGDNNDSRGIIALGIDKQNPLEIYDKQNYHLDECIFTVKSIDDKKEINNLKLNLHAWNSFSIVSE